MVVCISMQLDYLKSFSTFTIPFSVLLSLSVFVATISQLHRVVCLVYVVFNYAKNSKIVVPPPLIKNHLNSKLIKVELSAD